MDKLDVEVERIESDADVTELTTDAAIEKAVMEYYPQYLAMFPSLPFVMLERKKLDGIDL